MTNTPEPKPWNTDDDLDVEHITPATPKSRWESITWAAIKEAIRLNPNPDQVIKKMQSWNAHNDPPLPEKGLYKKTVWGIQNFDKE